MKRQNNKQRGYTIIETMISVSLFIIIIMSGMGALLNANLIHLKSQDARSIMDNLSFVMEDMSRNLRTGYNYQCFATGQTLTPATLGAPRSCPLGWAIAFEAADGDPASFADQRVYYILNDGNTNTSGIFKSTDGANSFIKLTPNEVVISSVSSISVLGAEPPPGNTQQPLAIIRLIGTISTKNTATPFYLQSSASQRLVDI